MQTPVEHKSDITAQVSSPEVAIPGEPPAKPIPRRSLVLPVVFGMAVGVAASILYFNPDLELTGRELWRKIWSVVEGSNMKAAEAAPVIPKAESPKPAPPNRKAPAAKTGRVTPPPAPADSRGRVITLPPFHSNPTDPAKSGEITLPSFEADSQKN